MREPLYETDPIIATKMLYGVKVTKHSAGNDTWFGICSSTVTSLFNSAQLSSIRVLESEGKWVIEIGQKTLEPKFDIREDAEKFVYALLLWLRTPKT